MDNLNKENFWNDVYDKYPNATQVFCDWIDVYKKENNWDELFNAGHDTRGDLTEAPKFHDLPIEMQQGIWIKFVRETNPDWMSDSGDLYEFNLEYEIKIFLEEEEIRKNLINF